MSLQFGRNKTIYAPFTFLHHHTHMTHWIDRPRMSGKRLGAALLAAALLAPAHAQLPTLGDGSGHGIQNPNR